MPRTSQGAEMHPKTGRQQTNKQPAAQIRKHSLKPQTKASMTTEYQERFLPPTCYVAIVTTAAKKSPYHPLKGTSHEITSLRSFYIQQKWIKKPPKVPQPPEPDYRRCKGPLSAANHPANQTPSRTDYMSIYQNDFKHWEGSKRQPIILKDSLTVKHGLGNMLALAKEPERIANTTSYKSDYIPHPANPRPVKLKHSNQSSKDLPLEPRLPFKPKQPWSTHQHLDKGSDFFEKFNSCSLETKFQGHTTDFSSPADHSVHCQVKNLPALEINDVPRHAASTVTDDYRVWRSPQSFTTVRTTLSVGKPKSPDDSKASPKTLRQHAKIHKAAACNSSRGATQKPQSPADTELLSSFECSTENGESKMYWYSDLGRGGTWPDGDSCIDHSNQIISCMVSTRN
ncbi:uncharacterized protein LOC116332919 isoform X1 [Oreochromis aureus]|uniref:uncharacterized protein LOC116332919 isoform X1 n=1 Tax=Oreochromis aureus TaxID=47969 RepID=UPI0012BD0F7F|nr:uncharacterized protein LOC116332919 isoform X1 [Oreochromis aureus]